MDFELSETQALVRETARQFADRALAPAAAARDAEDRFPTAELREAAALGLLGVDVPERLGGAEAGAVAYALAMIEISRGCAATAVAVAVTNMVAEVLCAFGSAAQQAAWVPRICSGAAGCASFALSEPEAGSDAGALRTAAERRGDRWVLRGAKQWISHADHAGLLVVWARTGGPGPAGLSAFLVPGGAPGMRVLRHEDKTGLRGSTTCQLAFEDCELPDDALLGEPGRGFAIAMRALHGGRIGIGAQSVGIATAALAAARRYARERRQFGQALAGFQAVQWMIADSAVELDAARLLTLRAAWLKGQGRAFAREASMAKVYASEAANRICDRAVQIHGGYGYIREFPVERHLRDARVTTLYEGTSEIQRIVIARSLLKEHGFDVAAA